MPSDERAPSLSRSKALYADVIVPRHITKAFTYLVPPALTQTLEVGHRVLVPFGRSTLEAAVVALGHQPPAGVQRTHLKEIRAIADGSEKSELSTTLFALSRKVAEHYVAPWGQCLRLVLPPLASRHDPPIRYVATNQGLAALEDGDCPEPLRALLGRIARRSSGVLASTLRSSRMRGLREKLEALQARAWIAVAAKEKEDERRSRKHDTGTRSSAHPFGGSALPVPGPSELPEPDAACIRLVTECLRAGQAGRLVVHAAWECRVSVLARAAREAHARDKSVIVLCGEVAKAQWLGHLLSSITGLPVEVLHRNPQARSLSDASSPTRPGAPMIVVGTRSALFTPVTSVGLIWVDGEDDPALKEPQEPRYHAREVAWMRAELDRALVVLASAHPSLESMFDSGADICTILRDTAHRPQVELVDLRRETGGTLLSPRLVAAMRNALEQRAGTLLFLNRKGYAGALVCRDCGWVPRCPACAVALTYYRSPAKLSCRYCGTGAALPESCPACQSARLNPVGEGTERVEAEVRRLLPDADIVRLDGDTLRRPAAARGLWERVRSGRWDILVGTQALFQQEPLPPVGLVGIIQADSGLHVPDFRAAERTYQHLVDAVAVARPAPAGGRVILQTMLPTHHAVESILLDQPSRFYDQELAARRLLGYPPACRLAALSVSGKELSLIDTAARRWREALERASEGSCALTILGPVPGTGRRPRGRYRAHMLVKGDNASVLSRVLRETVEQMEQAYRKGQLKFVVDVDPVETT